DFPSNISPPVSMPFVLEPSQEFPLNAPSTQLAAVLEAAIGAFVINVGLLTTAAPITTIATTHISELAAFLYSRLTIPRQPAAIPAMTSRILFSGKYRLYVTEPIIDLSSSSLFPLIIPNKSRQLLEVSSGSQTNSGLKAIETAA